MKTFLEEYGFAILVAIVTIVLILMASPVGKQVKGSMLGIVNDFSSTAETTMSSANEKLEEIFNEKAQPKPVPELEEGQRLIIFYANGGRFCDGTDEIWQIWEMEEGTWSYMWATLIDSSSSCEIYEATRPGYTLNDYDDQIISDTEMHSTAIWIETYSPQVGDTVYDQYEDRYLYVEEVDASGAMTQLVNYTGNSITSTCYAVRLTDDYLSRRVVEKVSDELRPSGTCSIEFVEHDIYQDQYGNDYALIWYDGEHFVLAPGGYISQNEFQWSCRNSISLTAEQLANNYTHVGSVENAHQEDCTL